jgi:uncharacterized protein
MAKMRPDTLGLGPDGSSAMRWCRYTALAACVLALTSCSRDTDKLAKEGPEVSLLARAFTAFGPPGQGTREATCFPASDPCRAVRRPPPQPPRRPAPVRAGGPAEPAPLRSTTGREPAFTIIADAGDFDLMSELVNTLNGNGMRVMPVVGLTALHHLDDITKNGIDLAVVPANVIEARRNAERGADEPIRYIARLYDEKLHVLANRDITELRQLDGLTVNTGRAGSGADLAARAVFGALGIEPIYAHHDDAALQQGFRSGAISAAVVLAARPAHLTMAFDLQDRIHLLAVPDVPGGGAYRPASLEARDYPGLIAPGAEVPTIAVANVLAVSEPPRASERYRRLRRFTNEFFARTRQPDGTGRLPWPGFDPIGDVPGWRRFGPVESWLGLRASRRMTVAATDRRQRLPRTPSS